MKRRCNGEEKTDTTAYMAANDEILDVLTRGINLSRLNDSISHNYIVRQIPQYMAGIEISRNILKYSENDDIGNIAGEIVRKNTELVARMRIILPECAGMTNKPEDIYDYQRKTDQVYRQMFNRMKNARRDAGAERHFVWTMIPYCRGTVLMAENLIRFDVCGRLFEIVDDVLQCQNEISEKMIASIKKIGYE